MAYMNKACAVDLARKCSSSTGRIRLVALKWKGTLLIPITLRVSGLYPIPTHHGIPFGELASYFNEQFSIECDLVRVEMDGWKWVCLITDTVIYRGFHHLQLTTGLDMMLLYPEEHQLSREKLSEYLRMTAPLQTVGAPFIDGEQFQDEVNALGITGVRARAISFTPTYQKFTGELCEGIQLHISDRLTFKPLNALVNVLAVIAKLYPKELKFLEYGSLKHPMFDLLAGQCTIASGIDHFFNGFFNGRDHLLNGKCNRLIFFIHGVQYFFYGHFIQCL